MSFAALAKALDGPIGEAQPPQFDDPVTVDGEQARLAQAPQHALASPVRADALAGLPC
jgi:hypothetical protein